MATRRDQLHSYQFMTQRVISAFVMRETDPAQSPLRRGIGALFGGLMVAILIAAGFGVYGIITKNGTDTWKSDGSVVVEQETGASFVYLNGKLNPTLNFASAKLAAGRPNPVVYRVGAGSLAEVPRGVTIGIQGAPASLPAATEQAGLPWTACVVPGSAPASVLLVDGRGPAAPELGERGLLVKDSLKGMNYLIWAGLRHLVQDSRTNLEALFGSVTPTPATTAWLDSVPSGVDIVAAPVPNRGSASAKVAGHDNGQVLVAHTASGDQYYLVLNDGLAPITPLQQAVLDARFPAEPVLITVNQATQFPVSHQLDADNPAIAAPATPPKLATVAAGETICANTSDAAQPPRITIGGQAAALSGGIPTVGATSTGRALADEVLVPAGKVEVVRVPGSGSYAVITDLGVRYAVPSAAALAMLGYDSATAVAVPTALVNLIPAGVNLDPAAAQRPAAAAAN
jgi:type VII secretion protein EccB